MNNYFIGLELMIIGMGTVFISLYLLSVFLKFSGSFLGVESVSKNQGGKKVEIQKIAAKKEIKTNDAEQRISPKKKAAVTSAIYKILNEENEDEDKEKKVKKEFKIISIQRNKINWKR